VAPPHVSHYSARLRLLGDTGSGYLCPSRSIDRTAVLTLAGCYPSPGGGHGIGGAFDASRCPYQLSAVIEAGIIAMRTAHPLWGPRTIPTTLRREFEEVPSRSGIYRCLVRQGLTEPKARRRQR
jgi:hypothetical protein